MDLQEYILVVEPDDLIRELLERWLREAGYAVVAYGSDASSRSVGPPLLVIADIANPDRADATIAALKAWSSAPILALSARFRLGLGASIDAAQRLQVGKVLPKPFTREELLSAVRETLAPP